MAVFSRLFPTLATSYLVQTAGGLVSVPFPSEQLYDLAGMAGFLASAFVSLFYKSIKEGRPLTSTVRMLSARQLLLNGALIIWSSRLGLSTLSGTRNDSRFQIDTIMYKRLKIWFMQATWTFLVGLPVYLTNTLCTSNQSPLGLKDYIPLSLFTCSFLLEILANYQKSRRRNNGRDKGKRSEDSTTTTTSSSGTWNWSRHPKYTGEIGVWLGIWALAASALQHSSHPRLAPAIAAISPLFTWHLSTSESGISLSKVQEHAKKGREDPKH